MSTGNGGGRPSSVPPLPPSGLWVSGWVGQPKCRGGQFTPPPPSPNITQQRSPLSVASGVTPPQLGHRIAATHIARL